MVDLTQFMISSAPVLSNWIGKLIYWMYQGIDNFGWTVVVFTIALKLILSPLDIWQRRTTIRNNRAMKIIAPELEKLKKTYANAPDVLQQKQMELYKKNGYSMTGGCLPALLTIVIFFIVFSGFNAAVRYENERIVYEMTNQYIAIVDSYPEITQEAWLAEKERIKAEQPDITDEALDAAMVKYVEDHSDVTAAELAAEKARLTEAQPDITAEEMDAAIAKFVENRSDITTEELDAAMVAAFNENKQGWLWVKNVFMPDTYVNPVPTLEKFVGTGLGNVGATQPSATQNLSLRKSRFDNGYDTVIGPAIEANERSKFFDLAHWNGYFILPLISITLSIFSVKMSKQSQPEMPTQTDENGNPTKNGQGMMKAMNWMMPIMMGVFAIFYSAAFCIYMTVNSLITVLFNLVFNAIAKKQDAKAEEERLATTFRK